MENKDSLYAVFDERNRAAEMAGGPDRIGPAFAPFLRRKGKNAENSGGTGESMYGIIMLLHLPLSCANTVFYGSIIFLTVVLDLHSRSVHNGRTAYGKRLGTF